MSPAELETVLEVLRAIALLIVLTVVIIIILNVGYNKHDKG